jgi:hypothetical protein
MGAYDLAAMLQQTAEARRAGRVRSTATPPWWVSAIDLLRLWGEKNPAREIETLQKEHPGLGPLVEKIQFPGKGQRPTPCIHESHIPYLLHLWTGEGPAVVPQPIHRQLKVPGVPREPRRLTVLDGPYGWTMEGGQLVKVPEEQTVLKMLRIWLVETKEPMQKVVAWLNREMVPSRSGARWDREMVESVMARAAELLEEEG